MQVVLPDLETKASFEVRGKNRPLNDNEFFEFCMKNPKLRIERIAHGDIVIVPPAGSETSYRNNRISAHLFFWAEEDGRGVAFDSSAAFILPSGAILGPDAAWVRRSRLTKLTRAEKRRFVRLCPDFVIEIRSSSDRLSSLKAKMDEWIENGAQLGWLIDADRRSVYIYRPGKPAEELRGASVVEGEGPVKGFRLHLEPVWRGL